MEQKYTRMKLKLLLFVVAGTLAAGLAGWFLLEFVVDGLLQDPFARFFVWVAQTLFGQSETRALELYQTCIRDHKNDSVNLAVIVMMLAAFYLAMGKFTRWLNQIGSGVRQVVDETGEPVKLPRELAPLQADLTSLQATLRAREAEAREAEQRKNDLLVFLAHDLKTPLTSVIGYLNLLKDDPDLTAEQRAKYTGIALDKALRLEDLMLEFFEITRESLHGASGEAAEIQLSILLEQLSDEFMPQFQDKNLTCRTDIQSRLTVTGEADKLARVFENVLRNAVNYSTEGGTVEIEAARQEDQVVIAIRNQGLEIPEQELALIFQKFYRLDSARSSRTGGAGLGLAIAKEIVEAHGGTIHAESTGQKTSFIITLPAAQHPVA
ncbi:MAG: sensor histidine kinase [Oscillospiraceae bacterium]